jgi:hypothetical protein
MRERFEEREMPRQARLDVAGTLHHIILRGIDLCRLPNSGQKAKTLIKIVNTVPTSPFLAGRGMGFLY